MRSPTSAVHNPPGFNCLTAIYYYDSETIRQRRNLGIHEAHGALTQFDTAIARGRRLWMCARNAIKITNLSSTSSSALIALGCISSAMGSTALHACVRIGLAHLLSFLWPLLNLRPIRPRINHRKLADELVLWLYSYRDCGSSINAWFLKKNPQVRGIGRIRSFIYL